MNLKFIVGQVIVRIISQDGGANGCFIVMRGELGVILSKGGVVVIILRDE